VDSFYELLSLALSAFLSATLLPGSSEVVLASLAALTNIQTGVLLLVATVFNTAGSTVNWWLGLQANRFQHTTWFPVTAANLQRAAGWFQRFGKWSLLLSWVPLIGDGLTVAAGVLRVKILPFLLIVGMAKFMRYAAVLWGVAAFT
jgi:membrane protein YqaA with SNARE-associated domain